MRNKKGFTLINFIITISVIFIIYSLMALRYGNETKTIEKIEDVSIEITNSSNGIKRKKYVFTDSNTYEIEDRTFRLYFNSMDTYRGLKAHIGDRCELTTIGHRIGLLSMYKTVIDFNCSK